jgi:hypothetical protein
MGSNVARAGVALILAGGFMLWSAAQPANGCSGKMKTQNRTPQTTSQSNSSQSTAAAQSALLRMVQQTSALVGTSEQPRAASGGVVAASFANSSSTSAPTIAEQQEKLVTGLQNLLKRQHGELKPYQIHTARERELAIRKQLGASGNAARNKAN